MSHIATIDLKITDLDALEKAAEALDMELVRNTTKFHWYNDRSFDPAGYDRAQKCQHILRVKNAGQYDYEIGLVPRGDGQGFEPIYDPMGANAIHKRAGQGCAKLKQQYSAQVSVKALRKQGYRVGSPHVTADGKVVVRGVKS